MPGIGGKMDAFQNVVGQYILSITKPDWQYWIREQAYAGCNPAGKADPASCVLLGLTANKPS
jgi:hypothetical protein